MTIEEILNKIYNLYSSDFDSFNVSMERLGKKHNADIQKAFMLGSLRLIDAKRFLVDEFILANLLCYISVETLSNTLEYFDETKGIKHTDFSINYKIERNINKTQAFQKFLMNYSSSESREQIIFKKEGMLASFEEAMRYLYLRNRCLVVHKGLFRTLDANESLGDVFIDEQGNNCSISIEIIDANLTEWFFNLVKGSYLNFLNQN